MKNILQKLSQEEDYSTGTSLKGYLHNTTYAQLIEAFGQPTYTPEDSGDGKVNFEWIFEFNGEIFTVYDWKTYNVQYTINELTTWNIGGKTSYVDFSNYIEEVLNSKQVENA
jgi:hypothetical protein